MKLYPTKKSVAGLVAVFIGFCSIHGARGESFGINFMGNSSATVTGGAGVVPITNWNNVANSMFTSGSIHSSDGSLSATLTLTGSGRSFSWNNGSPDDGADGSLMSGYIDAGINNPVTNTITGLTGSSYTLYIYLEGDQSRPGNGGDWLPNYTVNGTRYYAAAQGGSFIGYVEAGISLTNSNEYPPPIGFGNFIKLDDVAPASGAIVISANSDNQSWRSPINGIELIANTAAVSPNILSQTGSLTNYAGSTVQLTVVASGTPLNYQWQAGAIGSGIYTNLANGGNISGANSATLTISNLNFDNMADYVVTITNTAGAVTSFSPTTVGVVTMFLDGPYPASVQLYPGASAHLGVFVTGTAPLTYQWRKNGIPFSDGGDISGTTTNVLNITGAGATDAASYDLVITNIYGAVTSAPVDVTLAAAPASGSYAQAIVNKGPVAYWRLNETSGTSAYDYVGGHTANYDIYSILGSSGPASPDWPGFEAGNLSVQTINLFETSRVEMPAGTALKLNTNTVTITAWLYPTSAGTPNAGLVFQRGSGSVAGLNLNGNGNLGYNWNDDSATWGWDSGLSLPVNEWSFVALVVTPTNATMYLYNTNGQTSASLVHNHANSAFAGLLDLGNDPVFHDGSRVFNGGLDEVAIFKRALAGTEIVQLYSLASGTLVAPSVSVQPQSQIVLAGTSPQFSVTAAGTEPLYYQWLKDGANVGAGSSGANSSALTLSQVTSANDGSYSVVVTNQAGSVTSSVVSLSVVLGTNYTQGVAGFSPLGYWRLNEISGTTANDSSGHSLNGTYQSAVTLGAAGVPNPPFAGFEAGNRAASLDGQANSWVSLPAFNLNSDAATFTAWLYPTNSQNGSAGVVYCRDGAGTTSGLSYNPSGNQLGYTWNDDGGTYGWNSGLTPPLNQWSFVALVVTPTNASIYMFNSNGRVSASQNHTHNTSAFAGETRIGNDSYSASRTFRGSIDEVAVFNSAFGTVELTQLYLDGTSGTMTPPAVTLGAQRSGANIVLTWQQGILLESTNVAGPWTTNSSAASPYPVTPDAPQKFYRVLVQ